MCGIHGIVIKNYEVNADDFIKDAFVAGSLRGMDSSGIAQIDTKKHLYESHKLPINGSFFITDKMASSMIREGNKAGMVNICHTRHATVGSVNRNTAHPFECYDEEENVLLGVHNGTLTNWRQKKGASSYNVDSEWALNHILHEKFDAFEDFTGAFCFVWWESANRDVLNIARNSERPMHVVMLKSGGMAYASEAGMLYWLLERRGIKMDGPIMALEEGYWYKFPVDNPANFSRVKLPEAKSTVVAHTSTYSRATIVDAVKSLIERTSKAATSTTSAASVAKLVSQEEHDAAVHLTFLGKEVDFTPWSEYAGVVEGTAELEGSELLAEVRGDDTQFSYNDMWKCKVIGAVDDGVAVTLILGPAITKRRVKTTAKAA